VPYKSIAFLFLIISVIFINHLLAVTLGLLGRCQISYLPGSQVKLLTSCVGFTERFISHTLQASAITLDSHIITPLPSLAPEIVSHEMGHVFQYRILGPIFLPAYAIAQLIAIGETRYLHQTNVHARNYFEIWANSISHLPLEPTY